MHGIRFHFMGSCVLCSFSDEKNFVQVVIPILGVSGIVITDQHQAQRSGFAFVTLFAVVGKSDVYKRIP
jgi:hypothetical protein